MRAFSASWILTLEISAAAWGISIPITTTGSTGTGLAHRGQDAAWTCLSYGRRANHKRRINV